MDFSLSYGSKVSIGEQMLLTATRFLEHGRALGVREHITVGIRTLGSFRRSSLEMDSCGAGNVVQWFHPPKHKKQRIESLSQC